MAKKGEIAEIREFNRFYTVWLDILSSEYLGSDRSWTESRIIYEIYALKDCTAQDLCHRLHMDKSYMSRILRRFEKEGLLVRETIPDNRRAKRLELTVEGRKAAMLCDQAAINQIQEKTKHLDAEAIRCVCGAMKLIMDALKEDIQDGSGNS